MRQKRKESVFVAAFLLTALLLWQLTAAILRPAHTSYGSTWKAYRCEPRNSIDVLFLGSSYAYCDWNPGIMYAESGLTGYVMGGSEQTPGITYYYLREALRTQTPSVVIMEGSSLLFQRYQNYTQVNVGYMPWGMNRLGAILNASERELWTGLFLDLWFYHDRWRELTLSDIKQALTPPAADNDKGHTAVDHVFTDVGDGPIHREMDLTQPDYEANLRDFGKIAQVCRKAGIPFYVTINPTYSRYDPDVYARLEADIHAQAPEVRFYNWSEDFAGKGLSLTEHLYDGWHLNQEGAKIYSAWMGRFLLEEGFVPRPQSAENAAAWQKTADHWRTTP